MAGIKSAKNNNFQLKVVPIKKSVQLDAGCMEVWSEGFQKMLKNYKDLYLSGPNWFSELS